MSEADENATIKIGNDTITLADLAGISLDDTKEKRFEALPKGFFSFEVDAENPPSLVIINGKGAAQWKFKVIDVATVTDPEFKDDPATLIGKYHQEVFFLAGGDINSEDGLGYLKAFIHDIGAVNSGMPLGELLTNCAGVRFAAPIGKRKDPNDSDKVFTNIVRGKIKPLEAAAGSEVAAKVAA